MHTRHSPKLPRRQKPESILIFLLMIVLFSFAIATLFVLGM